MPAITIISQLQARVSELQEAYNLATESYFASCSAEDPEGCNWLMGHWEGASMELSNAQWQLEQAIEAVDAAIAAL